MGCIVEILTDLLLRLPDLLELHLQRLREPHEVGLHGHRVVQLLLQVPDPAERGSAIQWKMQLEKSLDFWLGIPALLKRFKRKFTQMAE